MLAVKALTAVLLTCLALVASIIWLYPYFVAHMGCIGARESLASLGYDSEPITFPSRLGYKLRGWYSPGDVHPGIVIVVLPGVAGNTQMALPDAHLLARAGYGTLLFEHRSCANPSLVHSGGYYESYDLMGAVDYLRSRPDVRHIGVLGFSTGGTAAIFAAAEQKDIEAAIVMGGFMNLKNSIGGGQESQNPLEKAIFQLTLAALDAQLGIPPEGASVLTHVGNISPRPLLLIYGEYESQSGMALYAEAGSPKSLWIVPGAGHGGYQAAQPREYENRILEFFRASFGP